MKSGLPLVSVETARRLLLAGQGLLEDPARRATPAQVYRQIERMGFVQVDTISTVERAHHHILYSRFDEYRAPVLQRLLERDRKLFEHWTHDASVIPTVWFTHWKHRFARYLQPDSRVSRWMGRKMGDGTDPRVVVDHVLERIEREGALMSRDFEHERKAKSQGWWDWKPQKTALEYLWRTGQLSVAGRVGFQKVYDLTSRCFPKQHDAAAPPDDEHLDWAGLSALERLGVATPGEVQQFYAATTPAAAKDWCARALAAGKIEEVLLESADGAKPRQALALPGWRRRAQRLPEAPSRMRLLNPFDPVIRDRKRALRLFGFDYTFEAFVPEKKRRYGYYVMPLLEGDRFVGRVDPKLQRDAGVLEIRRVWWEPGIKPTRARLRALQSACELLAEQSGAQRVRLPRSRAQTRARG